MKALRVQVRKSCCHSVGRRLLESVAMMMIGDGALAVIDPKRHMRLWARGPHLWEMIMQPWVKRPEMTRCLGMLELMAGIWLAQQQHADPEKENS